MIITARVNAIICYEGSRFALILYCQYNDPRYKGINEIMLTSGDQLKLDMIYEYTNMVLRCGNNIYKLELMKIIKINTKINQIA